MRIAQENAAEALNLIQDTRTRTQRAMAASYAGNLLILWGVVWTVAFGGAHFLPHRAGYTWSILDVLGILGTIFLCRKWPIRSSVAGAGISQTARRMFLLWLVLFMYAGLWVLLLKPVTGMLLCTFLVTVVMLGYVMIGLWSRSSFMIWLGLAMTGLALFGYHAIPKYFNLWMAPTSGRALLGTGLYIRIHWR